jgi:hypothetical protein
MEKDAVMAGTGRKRRGLGYFVSKRSDFPLLLGCFAIIAGEPLML